MGKTYKSIIISRLMGIGDTIMMTPLLRGIKELYPDTKLTLVTDARSGAIAKRLPYVDKAIVFERGFQNELNFVKSIFRNDVVYMADTSYHISALYALALVKKRIGIPHKRGAYLTDKIQPEDWMNYEYEPYLHMKYFCDATGMDILKLDGWYNLDYPEANDTEIAKVKELFAEHGVGQDYIAVSLETDTEQKDWPIEKWLELFALLQKENRQVVILGVKSKRLGNVEFPANVVDLRGETSLLEMGYVVKNASLLIAASSLFLHVAGAFNVPCIGLYGSQVPKRDEPKSIFKSIISPVECVFCGLLYENRRNCDVPFCMQKITSDMVFEVVQEFYEKKGTKLDDGEKSIHNCARI